MCWGTGFANDDVKLFTDTQPIPVTNNDTLVTTQNTPLTLDPTHTSTTLSTSLTTNDTNVSQIHNSSTNQPTHGTLTQTPDGKLTTIPEGESVTFTATANDPGI